MKKFLILILGVLWIIIVKEGNSQTLTTRVAVLKENSVKFFCNENQQINIISSVNVLPYIYLDVDYTTLEVKVYRKGFYQTNFADVYLFSNADVAITFDGAEDLVPETATTANKIDVDYIWDGFLYSAEDLNLSYTYLLAGEGMHKVEVDPGVWVDGAYLLQLKIRLKVESGDLINAWYHDPEGFIMTVVAVP
jgi:hypothetical protein